MSIIVKHKETKKKYVMIGTGYGAVSEDKPKYFGHDLLNQDDDEKLMRMVAVCDKEGNIVWYDTDLLKVVEIDGNKLNDIDL